MTFVRGMKMKSSSKQGINIKNAKKTDNKKGEIRRFRLFSCYISGFRH
jgi:hypothetical protein